MKAIRLTSLILFLFTCLVFNAQSKKATTKADKKNPATFTISKAEFNALFTYKAGESVKNKTNKYLDKSSVLMNTINGDTKFLKVKLNYFPKSFLMIQENGGYSTQVFVMSDDKSVFYKGRLEKENYLLSKCSEDDIVSE